MNATFPKRMLGWPEVLAMFLVAAPIFCGDDDSGGADVTELTPAEAQSAYQAYIEEYNQATCERELRCDSDTRYADVDACVAAQEELALTRSRIAESIGQGRTTYDPSAAEQCLEMQETSCDTNIITILQTCNRVIEGLRALDEDCVGHFECSEPAGYTGYGPYCFNECDGLFGDEDTLQTGICVAESPISTPACE